MTANAHGAARRNRAVKAPQIAASGLTALPARKRTRKALRPSGAVFEQLAIVIPKPRDPPDPPIPPLDDRRPRDKAGRARFDALAAMCRCTAGCAQNFADYDAYALHRPHGRCVPPAQVGLTRQTTPCPCWGQPKENP